MDLPLKLDFNERSDQISPLACNTAFGESLWRYPERQTLERQIAQLNGLDPAQVLCSNGGDEAIMLLMRIIKETSQLILPLPAFSQYTWGVTSWRLNSQLIQPKNNLSIDTAAVIQSLNDQPNSVTIITRPNNPSGEMIEQAELLAILNAARQNNSWVFLDEAYIEFSDDYFQQSDQAQSLLQQFDNLVILRTLSKAYGLAGIRLGYLLGNAALIKQFAERCMPFNIPQPSLTIASQALQQENRLEVQKYCQTIQENRRQLIQYLAQLGIYVLPTQANFITFKVATKQAAAIKSFLARNNVLVRTFNDELLEDYLRITIPYGIERLMGLLKQAIKPDLICLDMDGVLIDTSGSYAATIIATVKTLADKDVTESDIERLKNAGGFNNDWVLTHALLVESGLDISLAEVTRVFQSIYLGNNADGLVRNESAIINDSLVEKINQSQLTQFAIVTGRPRNEAIAGTQLIGLSALEVISLDDVIEPKPSPMGIQKLQSQFSNFSWMCGDNPDDMLAAVASNSLAIGIGMQNASILYQAGADIVLNNINEMENWL